MKRTAISTQVLSIVAAAFLSVFAGQAAAEVIFDGSSLSGWTGVGGFGTLGADGVVGASLDGGNYGYVTTQNASLSVTGLSLGDEEGGSYLRSSVFAANAGDELSFLFNYVTTDGRDEGGGTFPDYAWARLLDTSFNEVARLVFVQTGDGSTTTGELVTWWPLGSSSCYVGVDAGCGYTDWQNVDYVFASGGNYVLEFGVVNVQDGLNQSGLAFDGVTLTAGSTPPSSVPEPASLALLGLGLI